MSSSSLLGNITENNKVYNTDSFGDIHDSKADAVTFLVVKKPVPNFLPFCFEVGIFAQEASKQPILESVSDVIKWLDNEIDTADNVFYYISLKSYWLCFLLGVLSPHNLPEALKKLCFHMFFLDILMLLAMNAIILFCACFESNDSVKTCLLQNEVLYYILVFFTGFLSFLLSTVFCRIFACISSFLFYFYTYLLIFLLNKFH